MLKILKAILIFVFVIGFIGVLYLKIGSKSNSSDQFVVGMMSSWAPFMTINNQGEFEGFDVDVAKEIVTRLGKKLEIKDLGALASVLLAMQQGKIDVAMSGLDITQSRLQKMTMIPYTGTAVTNFVLVFWKKIPEGIKNIQDFKNIKDTIVCVEPGSSLEKFLDRFDFIAQKSMAKLDEMVLDIKYGKSLSMLLEPGIAKNLMCKMPELVKLDVPLSDDFKTFGMGIALKKENKEQTATISKIVKQMRDDGTLKTLEKRWGIEQ